MRGLILFAAYAALAYWSINALIDVETFWELVMYVIISAILIPIINIVIVGIFALFGGLDDDNRR